MDARDVLVVTPTGKQQVDPDYASSEAKLDKWYARFPSDTVIVTGFIASTPENIPTTLKRDGSDLSAAIMGALLQASKVTIWTDVDGVFSADPRKGNMLHSLLYWNESSCNLFASLVHCKYLSFYIIWVTFWGIKLLDEHLLGTSLVKTLGLKSNGNFLLFVGECHVGVQIYYPSSPSASFDSILAG
jgi:hypothetical protein